MKKLAPSILSADFSVLGEQVNMLEKAGADMLHIDVMDGCFVPNISFGSVIPECLEGKTKLPFDIHLMINEPDRFIKDFMFENTECISVHVEACTHLHRTLQLIKSFGVGAGVVLNPATPISCLDYLMNDMDRVTIMTVNPGFGGQKFISQGIEKISDLAAIKNALGLTFDIVVDGGINEENIAEVAKAGADILVTGSAVFNSQDPENKVKNFIEVIR